MSFSWETFFIRWGRYLDPLADSPKKWCNTLSTFPRNLLCIRFLALAFWDSKSDNPCTIECIQPLAEQLGFHYYAFSQNPNELRKQLRQQFAIELLRAPNENNQYLRTIQKYSGKMYVRIAREISQNVHSWDEEQLNKSLEEIKTVFCSKSDAETDETFNDAKRFFQKIGQKYREWNRPLDLEDLEQIEEAGSLTNPVLQKLHETLFPAQSAEGGAALEPRPQVCMGENGTAMYFLPENGIFRQEFLNPENRVTHIAFCFKKADDPEINYAIVSYDWNNQKKFWEKDLNAFLKQPPLEIRRISTVLMCWRGADGTIQREDVTPELCSRDFILMDADRNVPCHQSDSIKTGRYRILPLKNRPQIQCRSYDEEDFKSIEYDLQNCFSITEGTAFVKIGENIYKVGQSVSAWLDSEQSVSIAEQVGSRFFFPADEPPFSCNMENFSIQYDGKDLSLNSWNPPLWKRVSLEIFHGEKRVLKYPVTFIDIEQLKIRTSNEPVSWKDFQQRKIPFGVKGTLVVSIDNKDYQLEYGEDQLSIRFEYNDFCLNLKLPRTGVYLETPNQVKIPILPQQPHDDSHILELAREDYECCSYTLQDCNGKATFARGNQSNEITNKRSSFFKLEAGNQKHLWEKSDYCSIFLNDQNVQTIYRFHIYDPIQTPVPLEKVLPGTVKKTNRKFSVIFDLPNENSADLTLFFYVSATCKDKDKVLIYYPAHRQDQYGIEIKADELSTEKDEKGRFLQKLVFKNFYDRSDVDWGKGLLCFIATKISYVNGCKDFHVVSSGFFLGPKPGKETEIKDDPHGLRKAMAERNVDQLQKIMTSDDQKTRDYVAMFIENMTKVMYPLNAYPYLNSYWNKLTEEESGYIFLAGWYFTEGGNGYDKVTHELKADFSPYWDSLLIPYKYLNELDPHGTEQQLQYYANQCYGTVHIDPDYEKSTNSKQQFSPDNIFAICRIMEKFDIVPVSNGVMEHSFTQDFVFTYPQLSETAKKYADSGTELPQGLKYLLIPLYELWIEYNRPDADKEAILYEITQKGAKGICQIHMRHPWKYGEKFYYEKLQDNKAPYLFYPGYNMDMNMNLWLYESQITIGFSTDSLLKLLDKISEDLHEWRKKPTLEKAQKLRFILSQLWSIDSDMKLCGCFFPLRDYIRVKTLLIYQKEQQQNNI